MKCSLLLRGLVMGIVLCGSFKAQAQIGELKITTRVNAQTKAAINAVSSGKRATVLVDTPTTNGSAFCIHESGIFATNAHVVEGYSKVKIVVYPGETTQRILTARVSHYDDDKDLAVLIADPPLKTQAADMPPLTVLPLGDSDTLYETMPVAVFGFPFGTDLALDEREMPEVTVTTGRVTALRKSQGVLKEVQLDAAANPGNSGGPVINDKGEVIGIIYAGVEGAQGLNFAIPTSTLRTLLVTPEIRVDTPPIRWDEKNIRRTWNVRVEPFTQFAGIAPAKSDKIDINFQLDQNGTWRNLNVTPLYVPPVGYEFMVSGPVFIVGEARKPIQSYRIVARQNGQIVATREGSFAINLSANIIDGAGIVGRIGTQSQSQQTTGPIQNPSNGHWYQCVTIDNPISWNDAKAAAEIMTYAGFKGHLASITSESESQFINTRMILTLNGRNDKAWIGGVQKPNSIEPDNGWYWITNEPLRYTNWLMGEPNEGSAGHEDFMQILNRGTWRDAPDNDPCWSYLVEFESASGLEAITQNIDTPIVDGDKTIINLPSAANAVVAGGGGRFLLLYLKAEQKIAVFDAQAKKIVRYISAPGNNALLAASQDKLVVLLTDQNILQRWNLQTGLREQSIPLVDDKIVTSMALGSASDGPLFLLRGDEPSFLDLATLHPIEMLDNSTGKPDNLKASGIAIAAPNGSTFAIAKDDGLQLLVREGNRFTKYSVLGSHAGVLPSFDGHWWFSPSGVFTDEGKPVVADQLRVGDTNSGYQTLVPAYGPTYFLALRGRNTSSSFVFGNNINNRRNPMEVKIYTSNDRRMLASLGTLDELSPNNNNYNNRNRPPNLPIEKRIHFLPDRNLLVTISDGTDQLILRTLNLKSIMSQDGNKYFFVASTPPRKVTKGAQFSYQLDVQSQVGGTKYSVESGPNGLTITPTGLVQWKVPADFATGEVTILIAVSNSAGQELYHTFKIQVK